MKNLTLLSKGLQIATGILLLTWSGFVMAITNGGPDYEDHPYVGLAVFDDEETGEPAWRCTGTLISSTVFLTAGHCTHGASAATIWFESDVESGIPDNGYPLSGPTSVDGVPYTHLSYNENAFVLHDLGVVVLDQPKKMKQYGALPALGLLNSLVNRRGIQDTTFHAVGYGLQYIRPVTVIGERVRMQATLNLVSIIGAAGIPSGTSIMLSNNVATGGTCFGDSGGPIFYNAESNVVAAVVSFGLNGNCVGVGGGYRVDTADDLDWLYTSFGDQL